MVIKKGITFFVVSCWFIVILSRVRCRNMSSSEYTDQQWRLLHTNIGLSAMHMQLLHNNKVVMFDRTDFGPSNLSLPPGRCRFDPNDTALKIDCTAHSLLYDVATNTIRPLMVQTDTWCSSGALLPDGTLLQTGGYNDGDRAIRQLTPCNNDECDWIESPGYLSAKRWYATNQILPDGRVIILGGRREFSYEFYPRGSSSNSFWLNFLRETRDNDENNLYPFLHLLPDGNLFIFANTRSISFDYVHNRVVREFPPITGGEPRNYPSSGSSVLLPLQLFDENRGTGTPAEVLICGGAPAGSFSQAGRGRFIRACSTCGRLKVTDHDPKWIMEEMPMARVMGDMLLLPTGDVIIINGACYGTAGWENARDPVTKPVIYRTYESANNQRFSVMQPSPTPRLYHSTAVLLPDGRILVGGSNPHPIYRFTGAEYPTDLSLESFSPPYLAREHAETRPTIVATGEVLKYGELLTVDFTVQEYQSATALSVTIVAPSFTTHSVAMNQRLVVLRVADVSHISAHRYQLKAHGPPSATIAPSGYYLLFVVHAGIPSSAVWVKIQ
ncbi:PREDICTED: aldehyde oxidase GLOX [Nelumbo nucifera]|uniref:Aldehyde oxidase GLOX-like n=2 Tax=Nelumbo nucifera TaxID=4432 RepID=A0A822XL74_NELNU|nr:PREDICTED: aldehyde oxidase GLOX [Nelumbo nucifera]DAD19575.1 TPA_asm: hypothetical protein HUJ06_021038 [Nelumbo nucifera]